MLMPEKQPKTTQKRTEELSIVSFFFFPFAKEPEQHNRPPTSCASGVRLWFIQNMLISV